MSYEGVQIEAEMLCDCGKSPHDTNCNYYFNPMTTENWKEEFVKQFGEKPALIAFIFSLLTRQAAELRGKIEYLRRKVDVPVELREWANGWDESCDEMLALLEPDTSA